MKQKLFRRLFAAAAVCTSLCLCALPAFAGEATTEANPTRISWAKMSEGEAKYDETANTMTFVSDAFKITPMMYSCRGEGAFADSPYSTYNDTEFRFTFQVKPNGSYDGEVLDEPEEGEWYATFSFRNPNVGASGQEWEAAYASFFSLRENYTGLRVSSGSTARKDALMIRIPRRVKVGGVWTTDDTCVDYLDDKPHTVAISLTENDRQITVKIDDETIIDVNLDTYEGGKYSAHEVEPVGGYQFQAMNSEVTISDIAIWGNDQEKDIVVATGVDLDKKSLDLKVGDSARLRAKIIPAGAESKVVWESSDPTVATVNETGSVTALKAGQAVITAKVQGYDDIQATCAVTVSGGESGGSKGCGGAAAGSAAFLALLGAAIVGMHKFF